MNPNPGSPCPPPKNGDNSPLTTRLSGGCGGSCAARGRIAHLAAKLMRRVNRRLRPVARQRSGGSARFRRRRLSVSRSLWLPSGRGRRHWVVTLSSPALSWVSSSRAARAKTADGNQLQEAPRLGARPGPSPAPADPAKRGGDEGAPAPLPPSAAGPRALARPARLMLSRCEPGSPPPPGPDRSTPPGTQRAEPSRRGRARGCAGSQLPLPRPLTGDPATTPLHPTRPECHPLAVKGELGVWV